MLPFYMCLAGEHKNEANRGTESETNTFTNPLLHVFQQMTKEGNFGREQK